MRKFIIKTTIITLLPICLLLGSYLILDPFKVIYSYDNYSRDVIAGINRDYISSEMFLKNYPKYHYDSFVFGSSRSEVGYSGYFWKKYLPEKSQIFSFDASGESIYGIYTKIKYLNEHNMPINNALIVLCRDCSFLHDTDHQGHLFMKHPKITEKNKWNFQKTCFKTYLNSYFLFCLFDYLITKKYKPYMGDYIPKEGDKSTYDSITNEIKLIERKIPPQEFYERPEKEKIDSIQRITEKQTFMLSEIHRILKENHTNYKVVISPLYEQIKFNPADFAILKDCFGENLYDFSGKNKFTDNKKNYFETSHYKTCVGDSILKIIYTHNIDSLNIMKNN